MSSSACAPAGGSPLQHDLEAGRNPLHQGSGPHTLWTITNTAEALPGVLTPLGWTFWNRPCELGMREAFREMAVTGRDRVRFAPTPDGRFSAVFWGRYAANVEALREMADAMPGTSANALEEQLLGAARPGARNHPRRRRYPLVAVALPRVARRLPGRLTALRAGIHSWWSTSVCEASATQGPRRDHAALELVAMAQRHLQEVMAPHSIATMLCQAAYDQVAKLAEAAGRPGLETTLTSGFGDLEEAAVVADLWDVSRERMSLGEFLRRHGYHGPGEGELSSRVWREDQRSLLAQLDGLRALTSDRSPALVAERQRAAREEAEERVRAALRGLQRARTTAVLRFAARFVPLREVGKAAFLQCIDVGRAAARMLGEGMAARGVLASADDIFFFTVDELPSLVAGEMHDPDELVAHRRDQYEQCRGVRLPDSWVGEPDVIPTCAGGGEASSLSGVAVSPGVHEGRARVITDPARESLAPGEVLVCETTDPSWVSVMYVAAAMVVDIGGPISHGAIIGRELGVPTVVGTRTATRLIRTGDLVRVDGGRGCVELLERASR